MRRSVFERVEPTTILRLPNDMVRRSASGTGSPSAVMATASISSIMSTRAVCRRRLRGALPATTLSEPPG